MAAFNAVNHSRKLITKQENSRVDQIRHNRHFPGMFSRISSRRRPISSGEVKHLLGIYVAVKEVWEKNKQVGRLEGTLKQRPLEITVCIIGFNRDARITKRIATSIR
jgi:hypothetical protein